jgi:4-hydroxy-tetrahydrodipicolinate reductase
MPIKIGLIGAKGRLGTAIEQLASNHPHFMIAKQFGRGDDLLEGDFDLYIDVSLPEAFALNLQAAIRSNKPLVIGTTGLSEEDIDALEKASKQIPIFYAPNFSVGMAVMRKIASQTARLFDAAAEIEIIETHHIHKKDTPSGSAKSLATAIAKSHPKQKAPSLHSLRIGQTIGKHEIQFNSPSEQLTLIHTAYNRDLFAKGALIAARFLSTQTPDLYTMDHLLS